MSPQFRHQLPNGQSLNVVDVQSALKYLAVLIDKYDEGYEKPLIIGDETAPKAVVLPVDQWLDLLDIADEARADEHIAAEVRKNLADPRPPVPSDDFQRAADEVRRNATEAENDG